MRVADWFHSGRLASEPESRTDEYLRLPDRDDLGVKRRGGLQLDLKVRTGVEQEVILPDGFDGPIEAWTKWSFLLGSEETLPGAGSWVRVDKRRWSRFYAPAGGSAVTSLPAGTEVTAGCAAELVELAVGDRPAWGFGLEAFGDVDRAALLAATCRAVVADTPLGGIMFPAGVAHSYPAWLQRELTAP